MTSDFSEQMTSRPYPEYWSTLPEYEGDGEYLARVGEEFFPDAKPERYFESGEDSGRLLSPLKRRTFLKLGGFAALAAALQGCERPEEKVLPYVHQPEEVLFGVSNHYATVYTETPEGYGLLVASREGRPIKIEGNAAHPVNSGALDARAQGTLLDLYNPDRLRFPMRLNRSFAGEVGEALQPDGKTRIEDLDAEVGGAIAAATGSVVLLTRTLHGPSNDRLIAEFLRVAESVDHVVYDPLNPGIEREAHETCFGVAVTPRHLFHKARTVVCLGSDPLGQGVSPVEYQRGFAERRDPAHAGGMSRLYSFETMPSITGMKADYRFRMRPDQILETGLCLAYLLVMDDAYPAPRGAEVAALPGVRTLLDGYRPEVVAGRVGLTEAELRRVARALSDSPRQSIVHAGGQTAMAPESLATAIVANIINYVLGNYEETIDTAVSPSRQATGQFSAMARLCGEMKAGRVSVLIMHGVNPVYTLPESMGFREALRNVPLVVSLDRMMNETVSQCDLVIPSVHGLESWGDAEPVEGVVSIQQPLIRPIFGELAANALYSTRAWQESLMAFATAAGGGMFLRPPTEADIARLMADRGTTDTLSLTAADTAPRPMSWYDYVRETWRERVHAPGGFAATDFDTFWMGALQRGVVDLVGAEKRAGGFSTPALDARAIASITPRRHSGGLILAAYGTVAHGDGVSMGNPYLLELPDPVGRISWDNYAAIPPSVAGEMGLADGDHVEVVTAKGRIEIPVYIQPGLPDDAVGVMLGWGRQAFGGIGDGVGVNAWPLTEEYGGRLVTTGIPVTLSKVRGASTRLANVQGHNYLFSPSHGGIMVNKRKGEVPEGAQLNEKEEAVYDRPIVGETTLKEWQANPFAGYPNHVEPGREPESMWEGTHKYVGHHWGMVVDLNACTGCNACMVACSVENNVPVVGRDEVAKGREMHWIRIDRYYRGDKNDPDFVLMPLMCQHCGNAPCETVCPVIATMHNDEGLNVMAYNRCVGTRYCANNCPYKVRRFNFWQYTDFRTGPEEGHQRVSPLELVLNPDVTTRTKGVMEKCSFCVTRIRHAKDKAREAGRPLKDGEMVTACQQTCPAKAIHFGDRNDPDSRVAALWKNPRSYGLLSDLTTDPAVRYLTMVRNRDEASPYRTKYQSHREDHGHGEAHEADAGAHGAGTSH